MSVTAQELYELYVKTSTATGTDNLVWMVSPFIRNRMARKDLAVRKIWVAPRAYGKAAHRAYAKARIARPLRSRRRPQMNNTTRTAT